MSIRQRVLVGGVASVGLIGTTLGLYLAQAPEYAATQVQVEDTAGILYQPDLLAGVEEVRFYEPTTVAVFTHRGGPEALTQDDALNDAVLDHARQTRPDWLSANEQKWADDLFIFAVDPEGRLVGTYFGENRKVDLDRQLAIQDATKKDLRAAQWTTGAVTGVEAAAERMNAPAFRRAEGLATGLIGSAIAAIGSLVWVGAGMRRARKSRAARKAGDASMAAVVRDYDVTELQARLIPEKSRYGGRVLRRFDDYRVGFRELTELGNEVRSIDERDYDSKETLRRLEAYQAKATSLDQLDDVIADTAALLSRDHTWLEAWRRQADPLRADLEKVEPLLSTDLDEKLRGLPEAQALRDFASAALTDLDRVHGELEHQQITADDALDHLRQARDNLTSRLDALARAVALGYSDEEDEQEMMAKALRADSGADARPTIISTAYPTWTWLGVGSFRSGYTTGTEQVQSARSSSSSSGYSGGGSFSGAGSSSRF